jgi:hypothetical protein
MDTAVAGFRVDSRGKPFPDYRPVIEFSEYIGHIYVPGNKPLDGPGDHIANFSPYKTKANGQPAFGRLSGLLPLVHLFLDLGDDPAVSRAIKAGKGIQQRLVRID